MSKKNVFLVLILMIFLTVMAMSLWGKAPELNNTVEATSISFFDKDNVELTERNEIDNLLVLITCEEDEKVTYTLSIQIGPENTTDTSLIYKFPATQAKNPTLEEIIDENTYTENKAGDQVHSIYYKYKVSFIENEPVSIIFYYNNEGGIAKTETLLFTFVKNHTEPGFVL